MKLHDEGRDPLRDGAEGHDHEEEGPAPAMAISFAQAVPQHHEKQCDELSVLNSMVARQMEMTEVNNIPAAKAAMDAEWKKLWDMKCRDADTVQ